MHVTHTSDTIHISISTKSLEYVKALLGTKTRNAIANGVQGSVQHVQTALGDVDRSATLLVVVLLVSLPHLEVWELRGFWGSLS